MVFLELHELPLCVNNTAVVLRLMKLMIVLQRNQS